MAQTMNEAGPPLSRISSDCNSTPGLSRMSSSRDSASDLGRVSAGREYFRTSSGRMLQKIKRHLPGTTEYMNKCDDIACGGTDAAIPEGAAVTAQELGAPGQMAAPELARSSGASGGEYFRTTSGSFLSKIKRHLPGTTEYMEKSDEVQAGTGGAAPGADL